MTENTENTGNTEPDVRDMYLAHTMFRRELRLAAGLVRAVAPGDTERARTVADHITLVNSALHHHHRAEDGHLWPRLLERAALAAAPVVEEMAAQHSSLDDAVTGVGGRIAVWRENADPYRGAGLATALEKAVGLLADHLAVEEEKAIPLIERHITGAEWGQMLADAATGIEPEQIALIFGMMAYEGDPGVVRDIVAGMPPELQPIMAAGPEAYAGYALRLYGTATPERAGRA